LNGWDEKAKKEAERSGVEREKKLAIEGRKNW
jgi:hypothetical protein